MYKEKIIEAKTLAPMMRLEKQKNKKIVFTNGCFDILHVGHVRYLNDAKNLGDKLIVALNTDESVKKIKGSARPIIGQAERAEIIAALEFVDYVTFFDEGTPYKIIALLKPDILVKGGDYKVDSVVGRDIVELYGGKVVVLPFHEGNSTTEIIKKIMQL